MSKKDEENVKTKSALKDVKSLAHYLGVSRNTIHQWVIEDHIPYINLGVSGGKRIIRFDPDVIDEWLYQRTRMPGQDKPDLEKAEPEDKID